jgi:hypothetical protein
MLFFSLSVFDHYYKISLLVCHWSWESRVLCFVPISSRKRLGSGFFFSHHASGLILSRCFMLNSHIRPVEHLFPVLTSPFLQSCKIISCGCCLFVALQNGRKTSTSGSPSDCRTGVRHAAKLVRKGAVPYIQIPTAFDWPPARKVLSKLHLNVGTCKSQARKSIFQSIEVTLWLSLPHDMANGKGITFHQLKRGTTN